MPLDPIQEKEEKINGLVTYVLTCSAPVSGENFHFYWYANDERIFDANTSYAIINEVQMNGTDSSLTRSHLKFKEASSTQPTLFTCSLVFDDQKGYSYSTNHSYPHLPKCKILFSSKNFYNVYLIEIFFKFIKLVLVLIFTTGPWKIRQKAILGIANVRRVVGLGPKSIGFSTAFFCP